MRLNLDLVTCTYKNLHKTDLQIWTWLYYYYCAIMQLQTYCSKRDTRIVVIEFLRCQLQYCTNNPSLWTSFISAVRYKDTNYRNILQRVPRCAVIRAYKRTCIREIWSVLIARDCLYGYSKDKAVGIKQLKALVALWLLLYKNFIPTKIAHILRHIFSVVNLYRHLTLTIRNLEYHPRMVHFFFFYL